MLRERVQFLCRLTALNLVNCLRTYPFYRFETEGSTFTEEKPNWKEGPRNFLDMWKDWAEGTNCFHFVELITNQEHIDYDNGGDEDDNDEEAEKGEDALVLARRENDKYPLLPLINSNTPLDILKRILRVYVREVRSKSRETQLCASTD
jgi:hypothetical protein